MATRETMLSDSRLKIHRLAEGGDNHAFASDVRAGLTATPKALAQRVPADTGCCTVALFLGSNIGNFGRDESREFLRAVRKLLRPDDALLLGADLKKSPSILIPAYDDSLGVTAAFNLNLLSR